MPTVLTNAIEIHCTPEALYRYVSQPWRWHEWHPNSRSASSSVDILQVGDRFDEVIELQPLSPLPFRLRRQTRYEVIEAEQHRSWEVRGETRDGWINIRYEIQSFTGGARFTRTLTYEATGLSSLLMPFLKSRMTEQSEIGLANLKSRLEGEDEVRNQD